MELSIRTSKVIQIITFTLLASISEALINSPAYYIQTDEGPNRFFQFSSGPGGLTGMIRDKICKGVAPRSNDNNMCVSFYSAV